MANDQSELKEFGESVIKTELPLAFQTLTGTAVPAKVTRISFRRGVPESRCEMAFEVSGETARSILRHEWFHLFRSMRQGEPLFTDAQPVQFLAALRPELANEVAAAGGDAETVLDRLLPKAQDGAAAASLLCTECWLALEAIQTAELPEALKDTGTLKIGLRTVWLADAEPANANTGPIGAAEQQAGVCERIEAFLQEKELDYEKLDEQLLRLRILSDDGDWVCLIRIEEAAQSCIAYSVFPSLIPVERREAVALVLMSVNYDLTSGSFEMDHEDGELRFRSSLSGIGQDGSDGFGPMLIEHAQVMEHYLPIIRDIVEAQA